MDLEVLAKVEAMDTYLDELIAALTAHLAHSRGIRLAAAKHAVRKLVNEALAEHQEQGSPLGDDVGLERWIVKRPRRPPAA